MTLLINLIVTVLFVGSVLFDAPVVTATAIVLASFNALQWMWRKPLNRIDRHTFAVYISAAGCLFLAVVWVVITCALIGVSHHVWYWLPL